jgi:hypothetical protein
MELSLSVSRVLRRLIFLAVGGAFVLLFAGPILAVLLTVAALAVVGFLVWLPLHTALFGLHGVWRALYDHARCCRDRVRAPVKNIRNRCRATVGRVVAVVARCLTATRQAALEIFCGAAVGLLAALAIDSEEAGVVIGALLGIVAGAGVVLGRRREPTPQT